VVTLYPRLDDPGLHAESEEDSQGSSKNLKANPRSIRREDGTRTTFSRFGNTCNHDRQRLETSGEQTQRGKTGEKSEGSTFSRCCLELTETIRRKARPKSHPEKGITSTRNLNATSENVGRPRGGECSEKRTRAQGLREKKGHPDEKGANNLVGLDYE